SGRTPGRSSGHSKKWFAVRRLTRSTSSLEPGCGSASCPRCGKIATGASRAHAGGSIVRASGRLLVDTDFGSSALAERPDRVAAVPVDRGAPVAREHVVEPGRGGDQLDHARL